MNRIAIHFACIFSAALSSTVARAAVLDRADGSGLGTMLINVGAGERLQVAIGGCTRANGLDTTLYILEPRSGFPGVYTTRAVGEESAISDGDFTEITRCGSAQLLNESRAVKKYLIVFWSNQPGQLLPVRFIYSNDASGTLNDDTRMVMTGGARLQLPNWRVGGSCNSILMVKPERPGSVPSIRDPHMYAINRTVGAQSYYNNNGGIGSFPAIRPLQDCTGGCDLLAGPLSPEGDSGTVTIWDNRMGGYAGSGPSNGSCRDDDGVADDIESFYGTNSNDADTDQDGLDDYVELVGITWLHDLARHLPQSLLLGIEPSELMPLSDADPLQQDVFFEIDYMDGGGPGFANEADHRPNSGLLSDLADIFGDSAHTGRPLIRIHVAPYGDLPQHSQRIGHRRGVGFGSCSRLLGQSGDRLNYYTARSNPALFRPIRNSIYHYVIVGHQQYQRGILDCEYNRSSGRAAILGNDVYVTLQLGRNAVSERGTHVHEYGHNFGLTHNGNDKSDSTRNSVVHASVMNYRYQFPGWAPGAPNKRGWSYSRGRCDTAPGLCWDDPELPCVRFGQISGRCGGVLNNASQLRCDCDVNEWAKLKLVTRRFLRTPETMPGAGLADQEELAFLAGQTTSAPPWLPAQLQALRAHLVELGMVEGEDFLIDANGLPYAPDDVRPNFPSDMEESPACRISDELERLESRLP